MCFEKPFRSQTINPLLKSIVSKTDLFLLNAGKENTLVSFDDLKHIVLKWPSPIGRLKPEPVGLF
jgi:hypothetical protein